MQSLPIGDVLQSGCINGLNDGFIPANLTRNFLMWVQVLKVSVSESDRKVISMGEGEQLMSRTDPFRQKFLILHLRCIAVDATIL